VTEQSVIEHEQGRVTISVPNDAPEAPKTTVNYSGVAPKSPESPAGALGLTEAEPPAYDPPDDPTPEEDVERLLPKRGEPFPLESGMRVVINPLKLRGFLAMLKIITRGASVLMGEIRLNTGDEDFMQSMMKLFVFAIPESPDEVSDFLYVMVSPAEKFDDPEKQAEAQKALAYEFDDPDLGDVITIAEMIIRTEGADLRRLGKRLQSALAFAQKTNALNSLPTDGRK
jgi:hypothetical protein